MLAQQRFIVIYRDNPKDLPRYFGPFASRSLADKFEQQLPAEGQTFVRPFEPYAPHEIADILKAIENDRKH